MTLDSSPARRGRARLAVLCPTVVAVALLAAGCGSDSPDPDVASAGTITTIPGAPSETTTGAQGGATTTGAQGSGTTAKSGGSTAAGSKRTGTTTTTTGSKRQAKSKSTSTTQAKSKAKSNGATSGGSSGSGGGTTGGSSSGGGGGGSSSTPTVTVAPERAELGATQKFSGDGDKTIGGLKLERNVVVRWTVSGGQFELRDGSGKLKVEGSGKSGQSFAASGDYSGVKVEAKGDWTLTLTELGD